METDDQLFWVAAKAVIVVDGRVLMLMNERHDQPYWDFPGGRLQVHENVRAALEREVPEEAPGITALRPSDVLLAERVTEHSDDEHGLFMIFFKATATLPDEIVTPEHTGHGLFDRKEVAELKPMRETYRQAALAALN